MSFSIVISVCCVLIIFPGIDVHQDSRLIHLHFQYILGKMVPQRPEALFQVKLFNLASGISYPPAGDVPGGDYVPG